jgi:hypothetical protein
MKFSTRELVTLAVFGTLWGVVEISLGSVLHAVNLPMSGLALSAVGLCVLLIGRLFVPRRGSTLFIGVIAMILKVFSIGNVVIGPMIGILMEAVLAEVVLSLFPRPSRPAFLFAAITGALWTLIQPFVTGLLLFGRNLLVVWLDVIDVGSRMFGLGFDAAAWIFILLLLMHLLLGALAGWLAWRVGHLLQRRLQGNAEAA